MIGGRDGALFALCLALQGGVICGLALAARLLAPSMVVAGLALCFVPYAGAVVFSRCIPSKRVLDRVAIIAALFFGAALLFAPPLLSDDVYRYLWEGRVWLQGFNPYRLAPDDPALVHLRDDIWTNINNKPLATIYPPLSQMLFVVAQWLGGGIWTVKLVALLAHAVSTHARASLALALNPLLLSEAALNGHFDIACGAALLVSAWALSRQRFVRAGVAACVAVGLKLVGLVMLPLFVRRPRLLAAAGLGSALLLLPLFWWRTPGDPVSGAGQFATRWRGNESLFAVVDVVSRRVLEPGFVDVAARGFVVALWMALCAVIIYRRVPPQSATRALVWGLLLLSPQVHPWYLAWLLPLEVAAGGSAGLVWSAAVLCAYAPLDRWVTDGVWDMPRWLQIFEYSALALALILDSRRPSLRGPAFD